MSIPPKKSRPPVAGLPDLKLPFAHLDNGGNYYDKPFDASRLGSARPLPGAQAYVPSGDDGGYDSSSEEPPQNYHETLSRERDRKRLPDRKERKGQRTAAMEGWTHDAKNTGPGFYVRRDRHRFQQMIPDDKEGSCKSYCTAYICLRRIGYSMEQTLRIMKTHIVSWVICKEQRGTLAAEAKKHPGFGQFGVRTPPSKVSALAFSAMWKEMVNLSPLFKEDLPGQAAKELERRHLMGGYTSDIFFDQVIGCYASPDSLLPYGDGFFSTSYERDDNVVQNRPVRPPVTMTSTIQASLLAGYEACKPRTLEHPDRLDVRLHRTPMPFVTLDIVRYRDRPTPFFMAHEILIDFSDPDHPGIFDPNFGWMEPAQGFCTLSLEQALTTIWEYYTRNFSTTPERKGHRHFAPLTDNVYMLAYQIYVQSAQEVIKPPAPKSLFRSK